VSTAAATLLGLLFVSFERGLKDKAGIKVYLTPTVIYLTSVLLLSALLTVPNQAYGYHLHLPRRHRRLGLLRFPGNQARCLRTAFRSFPSYTLMVAGGLLLLTASEISLDLVAAGMLVLLCIAIRIVVAIDHEFRLVLFCGIIRPNGYFVLPCRPSKLNRPMVFVSAETLMASTL
jgi:hypothetical protein